MATYQTDVIGKPTDSTPKIGSATVFVTKTAQYNKSTATSEYKKDESYAAVYNKYDSRFIET